MESLNPEINKLLKDAAASQAKEAAVDPEIAKEVQTSYEEVSLINKNRQLEYKVSKQQLKLQDLSNNIKARRKYAAMIFWLIVSWLALVLGIVIIDGFGRFGYAEFEISETILITLITTTTANIAAFLTIVIRYIFPTIPKPKSPKI